MVVHIAAIVELTSVSTTDPTVGKRDQILFNSLEFVSKEYIIYFCAKFSHAIKVVAHGVVSYALFAFRLHGLYSFFRNKKNTFVPDVVCDWEVRLVAAAKTS